MTRTIRFIAMLFFVFGVSAAHAQEADSGPSPGTQQGGAADITANRPVPVEETQHDDWTVVCFLLEGQGRICNMQQSISNAEGVTIARISLRAENDLFVGATAEIITPLGTQLVRGVGLRVDSDEARGFPFQVCVIEGCVAVVDLTHEDVDRMRRGNKIAMSIQEFGQPNPVVLEISLKGFTKGFSQLTK